MHEANKIVVYSPALARQIPASYAAHAFNQFQHSMHCFEIVRLCALWDKARDDRKTIPTEESIPIIIELVDDERVRAVLYEEARVSYGAMPPYRTDPSLDEKTQKNLEEWLLQRHEERRAKHATKIRCCLETAIERARCVRESAKLASILNIRHKYLAHSLTQTTLEKKGSVEQMKYRDEGWLIEETVAVVDGLHMGINGAAFMWDDARQIACRNAEALWHSCKFAVIT
jgi:hypothetical protein